MKKSLAVDTVPLVLRALATGLLLITLFALTACGKEEKDAEPDKVEKAKATGLTVKILPREPGTEDAVKAVYGGTTGEISYLWEVDGEEIEGETTEVLSPENFSRGREVSVTVNVDGASATDTIEVRNTPPEITGVVFNPEHIHRGVDISAEVRTLDPDGDNVTIDYQWIVNGSEVFNAIGPTLPGDKFSKGDRVTVRLTPSDLDSTGAAFTPETLAIPNAPPEITSAPPESFRAELYTYNARAEDPDGDAVTWTLVEGPEGMKVSPSGELTWQVGPDQSGEHEIAIRAEDAEGAGATQRYTLNVEIR